MVTGHEVATGRVIVVVGGPSVVGGSVDMRGAVVGAGLTARCVGYGWHASGGLDTYVRRYP